MAKSQKLSKSRKSKSEKSKKLLKNKNLSNIDIIEAEPSFLIFDAKTVFNCIQLAFTKISIPSFFNLEYYMEIETNALGYSVGGVLNQLIFKISINKLVAKINLS